MSKMTIYLPDDLAAAARAQKLNMSAITQDAVRQRLMLGRLESWLRSVAGPPPERSVTHDEVIAAVHGAREDFGRG